VEAMLLRLLLILVNQWIVSRALSRAILNYHLAKLWFVFYFLWVASMLMFVECDVRAHRYLP